MYFLKAIVNIIRRHLTTSKDSVLNKGLNFGKTIKRIPYLDLIAPIEEAAFKIFKAQGRRAKTESETRTREIKASETEHLKERKMGPQIITVIKTS